MKLLTIIVPTYNMERYLIKCLSSLIVTDSSRMESLEVLIINDGSKDQSSFIAHGYERDYPGIFRVIDKDNGNYGSCINRGLRESRGKYVKILDADDQFDSVAFNCFLEQLPTCNDDLIISDCVQINEKEEIIAFSNWESRLIELKSQSVSLLLESGVVNELQMHNITYRRNLLLQTNYVQTEGISYTDTEWVIIPLLMVKTICYFHVPLYKYLVGREGQTVNAEIFKKQFGHLEIIAKKLLEIYESLEINDTNTLCFESRLKAFIGHIIYRNTIKGIFLESQLRAFDLYIKRFYTRSYLRMSDWTVYINGYWFPIKYWRMHLLWFFDSPFYHFVQQIRIRLNLSRFIR